MLSAHLIHRRNQLDAGLTPTHFSFQDLEGQIRDSLGIKLSQQSSIIPVIHYDIAENKLMYALEKFFGKRSSNETPLAVHVYRNENGYTKFVSDVGTLVVMPAITGMISGHELEVSWQEKSSNFQSIYIFETDTSLKLVEWIFTLDDVKAKAWVKKSPLPGCRESEPTVYSISISIEGLNGILKTFFDLDTDIEVETALELVNTLKKYDLTQMDFVKARAIADKITKITAIRSSFELSIVAESSSSFKCDYKNMCLDNFTANINGVHYFYIDENNFIVDNHKGSEINCKDGVLKCRGPKEQMFAQFEAMVEDIHKLREKYFNLFA